MPDDVSPETFRPHVGTTFDASGVVLELTAVTPGLAQPSAPRAEPFTLAFRGPPGLEQGTHALVHGVLGELEIFLVPVAPGQYEAVFN